MKRFAPAAERNSEPIASVLQPELPESGSVLETASGTGQHCTYFARRFPNLSWQPSDMDPVSLASIRAWRAEANLDNLLAPLVLDVTTPSWPVEQVAAVININMIHISPWPVCVGLLRGAGAHLAPGGLLFLYGPYRVRGQPTAPSNERFDASLRASNPEWGLRYLDEVEAEAKSRGLVLRATHPMPANNLSLIFERPAFPVSQISGPYSEIDPK